MLDHVLPDGRVPVLLTSHDKELVRQDAAAILDYLDRTAVQLHRMSRRRLRRPCCGCGGSDGTARCCGPPTAPSSSTACPRSPVLKSTP